MHLNTATCPPTEPTQLIAHSSVPERTASPRVVLFCRLTQQTMDADMTIQHSHSPCVTPNFVVSKLDHFEKYSDPNRKDGGMLRSLHQVPTKTRTPCRVSPTHACHVAPPVKRSACTFSCPCAKHLRLPLPRYVNSVQLKLMCINVLTRAVTFFPCAHCLVRYLPHMQQG
jgi:hypothetical protein